MLGDIIPFYFLNPLGNRKTWYKNQQTLKTHVTGRVVAERRVVDEVKLLLDEVEDKMEKQLLCPVGGFSLLSVVLLHSAVVQ